MNKKWSHCGYPGRAGLLADSRYGRENSEDGQDSMKVGPGGPWEKPSSAGYISGDRDVWPLENKWRLQPRTQGPLRVGMKAREASQTL